MEVLVAMAITAVITIVLFSLVGQSTTTYAITRQSVDTLSQARAFVQFFESEISTSLPDAPIIHVSQGPGGPDTSDQFAFFRILSFSEQSADTPGDLGISAYYVAFTADRGAAISPKLFRKTLNPRDTQAWLDAEDITTFPAPDASRDEIIIANVLDFTIRPKFEDPASGELTDWTQDSPSPLSAFELNLRFIDEATARRFTSTTDWNRLATSPRDNERQFIRSFRRVIPIMQ